VRLNGRNQYLGQHGTEESRERYGQFLQKHLAKKPAPEGIKHPDPLVIEIIAAYLDYARTYYVSNGKPTSEFSGVVAAMKPLARLFGESFASEFGPRSLQAIQTDLISKNYARTTINHMIVRIKRCWQWCAAQEYVKPESYHGLLCVKGLMQGRSHVRESKKIEPVSLDTVLATLPYATSIVQAMIHIQLLCGMRPGEVCRLRMQDVDATGDVWIFSPVHHKNSWRGTLRRIAIPQAAQAILKPFLHRKDKEFLFSPAESAAEYKRKRQPRKRKTRLYPCESKRVLAKAETRKLKQKSIRAPRDRYDTGSYRRAIERAVVRAMRAGHRIQVWQPNQLRHTIATEISRDFGQQVAQRWLGHKKLETTAIYDEAGIAELKAISAKIAPRLQTILAGDAERPLTADPKEPSTLGVDPQANCTQTNNGSLPQQ
jgi:integrase